MAINDASDDYLDALLELLKDAPQDVREPTLNHAHSVASSFENPPDPILILGRDGRTLNPLTLECPK
jgi:hypothetical protein